MVVNSSVTLLMRASAAALLISSHVNYFVAYLVGDMILYLTQKVARGDFWYWVPIKGHAANFFLSLLFRVTMKVRRQQSEGGGGGRAK